MAAKSGRVLWSVRTGGPVWGAAVVVAGVAYAGSIWGRITGVDARSGRIVLFFPHGEYVPSRATGAACSCTATRACGRSSRGLSTPRGAAHQLGDRSRPSVRRGLSALAALVLLAGGVVVGYVVYKREAAADVRGSSTEES